MSVSKSAGTFSSNNSYYKQNIDAILPDEILLRIFFSAVIKDLNIFANSALVCRRWRRILNDDQLCKELLTRLFPLYKQQSADKNCYRNQLSDLVQDRAVSRYYKHSWGPLFKNFINFQIPQHSEEPFAYTKGGVLCTADDLVFIGNYALRSWIEHLNVLINLDQKGKIPVYSLNSPEKNKPICFLDLKFSNSNSQELCMSLIRYKNDVLGIFISPKGEYPRLCCWDINAIKNASLASKIKPRFSYDLCTILDKGGSIGPYLSGYFECFAKKDEKIFLGIPGRIRIFELPKKVEVLQDPMHAPEVFIQDIYLEESQDPEGAFKPCCFIIHQNQLLIGKQENKSYACQNLFEIWDIADIEAPEYIGNFISHCGTITAIKPINDTLVLLACYNGTIQVFDLNKKEVVKILGVPLDDEKDRLNYHINDIDFDDGHIYATHGDGILRIWNYEKSTMISKFWWGITSKSYIKSLPSQLVFLQAPDKLAIMDYSNSQKNYFKFLFCLLENWTYLSGEIKEILSTMPKKMQDEIKEALIPNNPHMDRNISFSDVKEEELRRAVYRVRYQE